MVAGAISAIANILQFQMLFGGNDFYAVNPLPRTGAATLFMTHPPLAERVRRLRALDAGAAVPAVA
jgi:Zn-dependent protease with chaperone function